MDKRESVPPVRRLAAGSDKKRLYRNLLIIYLLVTICLSAVYLVNPRFVESLIFKSTDTIHTMGRLQKSSLDLQVVVIDEQSLDKYGQWPWPRYLVAQLLSEVQQAGAKAVSIDILFPEQDRTSPAAWLESATEKLGLNIDASNSPLNWIDFDHYLADTLARGPFVLGYSFVFSSVAAGRDSCKLSPFVTNTKIAKPEALSAFTFHKAVGVVCNYPPLAEAVKHSGFMNANADNDGSIRRMPLLIEFDEALFPSLALASLMQFYPESVPRIKAGKGALPATVSIAGHHMPIDQNGYYLLDQIVPNSEKYISAVDVLGKRLEKDVFKDSLVLVGMSASGISQDYTTPFATNLSSVDLQSAAIQSLTASIHTFRSEIFPILEVVTTFFLSTLLLFTIPHLSSFAAAGVSVTIIGFSWFAALLVYRNTGYLFSPLLPCASTLVNYFVLTTYRFKYSSQLADSVKGSALDLLQMTEDNLQSILNTIPDIVFRLDQNGKITFISPAVSKYLESSSSLLGQSIFNYVAPEDLEKAKYRINERRTGERATLDFEIKLLFTRDTGKYADSKRFFSVSAAGIYTSGSADHSNGKEFLGTQGIVRDITDRKRLEQQLLQAQKMEVVGNLAAGIAHDLNNILSGLVSYPDLLLLEIPADDPLHKKITVIQRSGKKAAIIVQDLLTLARRNINISEICNLNTIISDYLVSAEFQLIQSKNSRVSIRKNLAQDLLSVKGSAVHLSKLIMNILHNAIESMPAGGDIFIITENIYIDQPVEYYEKIPEGEYVCTTIRDTGIGISRDDIPRIFEPFYTKKSMLSSGTGIGMTVIWATIKDHYGFIDIKSKEGEGTALTFYLPTTKETSEIFEHKVVLEDFVGSESILIVDDVAEQRTIGENMLSKLGYEVFTVPSGEEAIRFLKENDVDLIVLDMIMPGGFDGLATYEAISEFKQGQKAIITSGFSESQRVSKLLKLGAGCYVQKPFTLEEIGVAVRRELDRPSLEI